MATKKSQRIAIWVIAIALTVGTLGSFVVVVLANQNSTADQARLTELSNAYQKEYTAYETKAQAQADELSTQYYDTFKQYESRVGAFDKNDVTELKTEDLVVGDGEELTKESSFTAYYIGWNPSGKVFDGSIEDGKLKAPFTASPGGVIEGWTEGVAGMKVGGVRELTIPSDKAYGEAGSGDDIPANTPLKFVLFVIPTPEKIEAPAMSDELTKLYQQVYGY